MDVGLCRVINVYDDADKATGGSPLQVAHEKWAFTIIFLKDKASRLGLHDT